MEITVLVVIDRRNYLVADAVNRLLVTHHSVVL